MALDKIEELKKFYDRSLKDARQFMKYLDKMNVPKDLEIYSKSEDDIAYWWGKRNEFRAECEQRRKNIDYTSRMSKVFKVKK